MWRSPSTPGASSTNAPNGCSRATLPLWRVPWAYVLHRLVPRIGDGRLVREPELALVVDAQDLDVDLRADLKDVGQLGAAVVAGLGHVHEALDVVGARGWRRTRRTARRSARCPLTIEPISSLASAVLRCSLASASMKLLRETTTSRPRLAYCATVNSSRRPMRWARSAPGRRSTCEPGANARRPSTSTSMPPLTAPVTSPSTVAPLLLASSMRGFVSSSRSGLRVSTTNPPREPSPWTCATKRSPDFGDEIVLGELVTIEDGERLARQVDHDGVLGHAGDFSEDFFAYVKRGALARRCRCRGAVLAASCPCRASPRPCLCPWAWRLSLLEPEPSAGAGLLVARWSLGSGLAARSRGVLRSLAAPRPFLPRRLRRRFFSPVGDFVASSLAAVASLVSAASSGVCAVVGASGVVAGIGRRCVLVCIVTEPL